MKGWNPFKKVDMEIGSFIEASPFYKEYGAEEEGNKTNSKDSKKTVKDRTKDS